MKYLAALVVITLSITCLTQNAFACSCIVPSAPLVELEKSDFVFSGKVKTIISFDSEYGQALLVSFEVKSKWKGDITEEVVLQTADNTAACGYPFKKGESYIVYGNIYQNMMQTGLCTRTNLLDNAQEDLRDLDVGEEFTRSPRCGGPTSAVIFQTFAFLLLGMPLIRRKPLKGH